MTTPPGDRPGTAEATSIPSAALPSHKRPLAAAWNAVSATLGAVMGLVPHVLHHVGLIAGAALVTGAGGNLLFFALGVVLSIPLLRRLYRRFATWKAPTIALVVFAVMFALSAFVIGPALTGRSDPDPAPGPSPVPTSTVPADHGEHHGG
ncbi:hypothetical protein D092_21500 [Rhodococcus ruber Chol-4]|uniref:Uncharacterized protein n=1 Tax=Rhodococcus ruber TaxID=1830 RepID=A0A098BS83_9NOCA|nr:MULTISPECIES: hypothetical protein [Rhodococcus]MDO2380676.1 hypothetical protein [Rhodococcus ruber]RIK10110.1 MAG: hypothetical protein DCC47_13125 [Acidobacteriota bacterium]ATQ29567.1 hypothetical protein CS378_13075 [Rhodococcus ruber]AUM18588.1 hypothetical protein CSW53_19865 [Rhodococcus ruber]AWH00968.1 hypothetical protein DCN13_21545 [Rhodococcus ruber]